MKVAIIIERTDTALGGAERSVSQLADALSQKGVDVTILAAKGDSPSKNVKQLYADTAGKRISLSVFLQAIKDHLKQNTYDIVHSTLPLDFADIYQPRGGSYLEAMIRNADSYQSCFVSSFKKMTHFTNRRRFEMIKAEKRICRDCPNIKIAALSEYVKKQFIAHYNIDESRIATIANGIALKTPSNSDEVSSIRAKWCDILGIKNEPILLFAANNFRLKGLASLIKAMALNDEAYLVVAGSGKPDKYLKLAERLNIAGRILFAGTISDITPAIAASDAVILPTYYDPCSRFILEGLAAEKPVITTKFNGAAEMFADGTHGRIISQPDDVKGLTEAIAFCTNPDNAENMSKAIAQDSLRDKISIDRHVREMIQLYEEIIQTRSSIQ
ncbi:MAG: glycosyltransferase family 4 protein [Planctomycetes bacterium]|nr:glycosyltransferase family 4 protein [Planctomycetota bacterium]